MDWWMKRKGWTVLVLAVCSGLCGCNPGLEDRISEWSGKLAGAVQALRQGEEGLSLPTLRSLLSGPETETPTETVENAAGAALPVPEMPDAAVSGEQIVVKLFFLNANGSELLEETRRIAKVPGMARATVEALLAGPQGADASGIFPEGTKLNGISLSPEGVCRLDFSGEIRGISSGRQEELATLAIVKTLAQFPTVQTVQFLIDGFSVNSLTGKTAFGVQ